MLEDYLVTCPPLSIAIYSLMQLSELGHCRENEKCPRFEIAANGIRTQALLNEGPAF